jgi:hypothetical protein
MPIISQILCDGCQAVKKQTNHWYTLVITDKQEACLRPMAMSPVDLFQADVAGVQYLCGRRCVSQALDRWMDGLTSVQFVDGPSTGTAKRGEVKSL